VFRYVRHVPPWRVYILTLSREAQLLISTFKHQGREFGKSPVTPHPRTQEPGVVQGDLNGTGSLTIAYQGATVKFEVTVFWTIFRDLATDPKIPSEGLTQEAFEVELRQQFWLTVRPKLPPCPVCFQLHGKCHRMEQRKIQGAVSHGLKGPGSGICKNIAGLEREILARTGSNLLRRPHKFRHSDDS
jgi:hypothetical protein